MISATGAQTDRQLLRESGALLLGGFVFATAVTVCCSIRAGTRTSTT
jgi:hypothetical protein